MPSATVRIMLSCPHRTVSSKLKVLSTESTSNDCVRRFVYRKIDTIPDIGLRQALVEDFARRSPKDDCAVYKTGGKLVLLSLRERRPRSETLLVWTSNGTIRCVPRFPLVMNPTSLMILYNRI